MRMRPWIANGAFDAPEARRLLRFDLRLDRRLVEPGQRVDSSVIEVHPDATVDDLSDQFGRDVPRLVE